MIASALILLSGIIAGLILFQSAIVAPIVFTKLPTEHSSTFLRAVFPVLFKVNIASGLLFSALAFLHSTTLAIAVGLLTVGLSIVCLIIVPATNAATDAGNQSQFQKLHRISVIATCLVLLMHLVWPFL